MVDDTQVRLEDFLSLGCLESVLLEESPRIVPLIVKQYKEQTDFQRIPITRLVKLWVLAELKIRPELWNEKLIFHRAGLVPQNYPSSLDSYVKNGTLTLSKKTRQTTSGESSSNSPSTDADMYLFDLTEQGKEDAESVNDEVMSEYPREYQKLHEDIAGAIPKSLNEIVALTFVNCPGFSYSQSKKGEFSVETVIDWTRGFGDGEYAPYHKIILDSYWRYRCMYSSPEGRYRTPHPPVAYDDIPGMTETKDLDNWKGKNIDAVRPLVEVLHKDLPETVHENLFEFKNRIANRWPLVEAVHMFNALDSVAPPQFALAFVTHINPDHGVELNEKDLELQIEKTPSRILDGDLRRLVRIGLLRRRSGPKRLGYMVAAKSFHDSRDERVYRLLPKEKWEQKLHEIERCNRTYRPGGLRRILVADVESSVTGDGSEGEYGG